LLLEAHAVDARGERCSSSVRPLHLRARIEIAAVNAQKLAKKLSRAISGMPIGSRARLRRRWNDSGMDAFCIRCGRSLDSLDCLDWDAVRESDGHVGISCRGCLTVEEARPLLDYLADPEEMDRMLRA
jgi:hypothetical protein